jgi:hypothetical protein
MSLPQGADYSLTESALIPFQAESTNSMMPFVVSLTSLVFTIVGTRLLPSREKLPPSFVSVDIDFHREQLEGTNDSLMHDLSKCDSGIRGFKLTFTWTYNVRSLSEMPRRVNGDESRKVSWGHFR